MHLLPPKATPIPILLNQEVDPFSREDQPVRKLRLQTKANIDLFILKTYQRHQMLQYALTPVQRPTMIMVTMVIMACLSKRVTVQGDESIKGSSDQKQRGTFAPQGSLSETLSLKQLKSKS